ncbi:glycosyl hydrolase family 28-related protein [Geodermatophilus normandii]|uniref:Rhamnogalacturonase A/B/Epimerase-like pectate lyase domain-containing protein n=1 Tax=Geodermatophilus normandii TaxID=1137989 RepID=A0A6P0GF89_9ACTN|nr:glycosyl hydrolase family 28-related protein [Geodermatophilus normandii]NEM05919.1 hypothetical protein [Geodermatophilus normandii]
MPVPELPSEGSTSWYSWARGLHRAVTTGDGLFGADSPAGYVDVKAAGAVGDGAANDTSVLQDTIDANAGKIIYFPPGTYNVSQLLLPSNTHLQLGRAVIRRAGNTAGAAGGATLRNSDQRNGNRNITVSGGTITATTGASGRPWAFCGLDGLRVDDLTIEKGQATFADWMFYLERCRNVVVDNIRIVGGTAVGEDGIHIKSSEDMVLSNCLVDSGDDAIVLVHEFNQVRPIRNITISNCVLQSTSAHLIRISVYPTETQPIEDVTLSNIVGHPPATAPAGNAVIIEDQTGAGAGTGLIRRITMDNIVINATGYPGNAVSIRSTVDSTFSNWRVSGASDRSYLLANCHRCNFTSVVADTPAASTRNPQWTVDGCTNLLFLGCEARDSRLWSWGIAGERSSDLSFIGCRSVSPALQHWSVSAVQRLTVLGCTTTGGGTPIDCATTAPPTQVKVIGNSFSGYSSSGDVAVANCPAGQLSYFGNDDLADRGDEFTRAKVGFFGTTPVAKPSVTGSRTQGTALASLLEALADLGLITDSSTS